MVPTRPPPLSAPARARRVLATLGVGLLLGTAVAVVVREPWHGPILLSLSAGHGVDAGDLPVVPLVALAVLIGRRRSRPPHSRPRPPGRWVGPASAVGVGAVLLAATATALTDHGALVPSGGGTLDRTIRSVVGPAANPVGVWSYVAVTYDGATLRFFANGAPVASRATTGTIATSDNPLWLGGNHPYGEYFCGLIDEARIYDRALDEAEIRSDMATPVAAGSPDLVGAYSFDTGTGTSVPDVSGHGNAGTITGATWTTDGRYGGALRFDGAGDLVRVPASTSLDMSRGLTLSAWIRPTADQSGWRTIVHRERDTYFLVAGSRLEGSTGWADDLVAGAVLAAAAWLAVATLATRGRWLGPRRRAWRVGTGVFLAGCLADAAFAPSGSLFGPALLAVWFAASARHRTQAVAGWLLAAALTTATVASITDLAGISSSVAKDDGGLARSAALGITLCVVGLASLVTSRGQPATSRGAREGTGWSPAGSPGGSGEGDGVGP